MDNEEYITVDYPTISTDQNGKPLVMEEKE